MAANPVSPLSSRFEVQKNDANITVICHGKLTNDTAPELKNLVKPLIPTTKHLVLDLSDVQYMDSSGLGTLMGLYTSAVANKTKLQLINLSPRVKDLLRITKLIHVFEPFGEHL